MAFTSPYYLAQIECIWLNPSRVSCRIRIVSCHPAASFSSKAFRVLCCESVDQVGFLHHCVVLAETAVQLVVCPPIFASHRDRFAAAQFLATTTGVEYLFVIAPTTAC